MSDTTRTEHRIRRVVTGHDPAGKAVVWVDSLATNHKFPDDKITSTLIWVTDANPSFQKQIDDGMRIMGTAPPPGGTRCGVLELQPGNEFHGLHRTDTVDYCVCVSGEIEMMLDDAKTVLKTGDVVVQRGTNHAWLNRSDVPARLFFVLIDAEPKRSGSVAGAMQAR